MRTKTYLTLTAILILFCQTIFAIPAQEDFYHKIYKIEWKGLSGKVLTQYTKLTGQVHMPNGWWWLSPTLGEHVSLYNSYSGSAQQQWIIAPITPGGNEFYIINKATGNPLMIDGTNIRCNTSGITDDRQRFKFKNINGDYFQIQSASTAGHAYKKDNPVVNDAGQTMGYYFSLSYVSTTSTVTDDYSYFKLTEVGDIAGSSNVSAANLIYRPDLLFNIPVPPELTSYTAGAPLYSNETVIGESWVPFCLVKDNTLFPTEKFIQTPFYKLVRAQAWEKVKDFSYEPGGAYTSVYKTYLGVSSVSTQTTQTYLEHSWTLTGGAEFISETLKRTLGASYSGKLSTTVTRVDQYSTNQITEKTITLNFDLTFNVRFVVYELVDKYYLKRMDGSDVIAPADVPKIYYEEISHERKWPLQGTIVSKNPITNTITISPDYTPRNLTIGASYNHPYIQWNASAFPNLAYYEIWKKKNGTWSLKTTTTNTNYTDSGELIVAPNVVVNYKVCAVNNSGQKTGFSNEVSISVGSMAKQNSDNAEQMENGEIPNALGAQNYPNPFNPTTVINYAIPQDSRVTLKVYNMLGQEVAALVDDFKTAGRYNVTFDASHLSTGMYIYRLTAGNNILVKKISFVK